MPEVVHPFNLPMVLPRTIEVRLRTEKVTHVMTLVLVHKDLVNKMWSEYLKHVNVYDKRLTKGWQGNAGSVLVFVSLHLLVPVSITVTIWETASFSSIVASLHYPKLQNSYRPILLASLCFSSNNYPSSLLVLQMAPTSNRNRTLHLVPAPPSYA